MSVQRAILIRRIEDEIRRGLGSAHVPDVIFRVLVEAGYDTSREPTAEEVKPLLVAALRAAKAWGDSPPYAAADPREFGPAAEARSRGVRL